MIDIYDSNGYLDFDKVVEFSEKKKTPFIFMVGARGIGKTFNSLYYCVRNNLKFMYIRRTKTQAQACKSLAAQPFKAINEKKGTHIYPYPLGEIYGFYETEMVDNKRVVKGEVLGYLSNLSTFANLNSADFSDVDVLLFDEFIAKPSERPINDEAGAYFNFYETIARNRELDNKKPLLSVCMANSNRLDNPLFIRLEIVNKLLESRDKGNDYFADYKRGYIVYDISNSPISQKKADTALYRLTNGTEYADMALSNDFVEVSIFNVKPMKLDQYVPICHIGEIYIYLHKSKHEFYITHHKVGTFNMNFKITPADVETFMICIGREVRATYILYQTVYFETYADKILFENYVKVR